MNERRMLEMLQEEEIKRFLHRRLFRFKDELLTAAYQMSASLGIFERNYVGVHIRRNDKHLEAEMAPTEAYAANVMCVARGGKVFLASDSMHERAKLQAVLGPKYDVVEQARLPEEAYMIRGVHSRSNLKLS